MATSTWRDVVRPSNGARQEVRVSNQGNATAMLEGQYGKGTILTAPRRVPT